MIDNEKIKRSAGADRSNLAQLVKEARERFDNLSTADQAAYRRDQQRSFVRGQMGMIDPDRSPEEIDRIVTAGQGPRGT